MMDNYNLMEELKQKIEKYFSDPKNVKEFEKYIDEELKKPYMTQLQCNCIWCNHNRPENPDMGTITYCNKYKATESKDICKDREWYG